MGMNLEVIKKALQSRRNDIVGNLELNNEILVDEFMLALGYNKKLNVSVKRVYDNILDWKVVKTTGNRIAIKTLDLEEDIASKELEEYKESLEAACKDKFAIFILTNGQVINIYGLRGDEYVFMASIDVTEELSEIHAKLLKVISDSGYDLDTIKKIMDDLYITYDKLNSWLNKYKTEITELIITKEEVKEKERLKDLYDKVLVKLDSKTTEESSQTEVIKEEPVEIIKEVEVIKEVIKEIPVEIIKEVPVEIEGSSLDRDEIIQEYRNQIRELKEKASIQEEQIRELSSKLDTANNKIESLNDGGKKQADELLSLINYENSSERQYAGVINTFLYKEKDITKFVAKTIQKLYDIVGIELSSLLFNGDMFELVTPSVNNHIVINNRVYDINMDGISETEALNRLNILMSNYPENVFKYRIYGELPDNKKEETVTDNKITLEKEEDTDNLSSLDRVDTDIENIEEIQEAEEDIFSNESGFEDDFMSSEADIVGDESGFEQSDDFESAEDDFESAEDDFESAEDDFESAEDDFESAEDDFESAEDDFESAEDDFESAEDDFEDGFEPVPDKFNSNDDLETVEDTESYENDDFETVEDTIDLDGTDTRLCVVQLSDYSDLMVSDEELEFNNIRYIGTNELTFKIEEESLDRIMVKSIDALLAIASNRGNSNIVKDLKLCELSSYCDNIVRYTDGSMKDTKITATRYCVQGTENLLSLVMSLYNICEQLRIDTENIFIYLDVNDNGSELIESYSYNEDDIVLQENTSFDNIDTEEVPVVLKGAMFNYITLTTNAIDAHLNIFKKAVEIKTKYLGLKIQSEDDIMRIIKDMVENYTFDKNNNANRVNSLYSITGQYKLLSTNSDEVKEEFTVMEINGINYYVSTIETELVAEELIKLHTDLYGNTAIAVRAIVNKKAIDFVNSGFNTSEPSLSLAVNTISKYIESSIE